MAQLTQSFHNSIDNERAYLGYTGEGWGYIYPYITFTQTNLSYQFFSHFHPYVKGLTLRLTQGGFDGLQDSDTLYLPNPNPPNNPQPLIPIPDSSRAALLADITGTRPGGGASVSLSAGTPMTLPAGTTVNVAAGTIVIQADGSTAPLTTALSFVLPGFLPVSSSSGIQNTNAAGAVVIPDFTAVTITLPAGASATLNYDGSSVQFPSATSVSLRSGLPQPVFYRDDFASQYQPDTSVTKPYPPKNLEFAYNGAYSIYNWELFFHAPLLIAIHLSQNQQYQDAQNWFHYIFNPTDNSPGPTPERFWKVQPFQSTDVTMIQQILTNLASPQDPQLYTQTVQSINEWMQNPFQPWAVAKYRPTAYMLKTVMAYLDNLIAWGDSLFSQYTVETINEATQIYVMAANIVREKPQAVPQKGTTKSLTYNDLRNANIDPFGNAMVDMEVDIPFDIVIPSGSGAISTGTSILPSIGKTLYFCIPQNDILLGYWDTVADRLFKIHNSLNLQGVFQQLPLFDPPIDPALLVRATAAGLDVSAVVSGINQPLPLVRFQLLVAKASEICQEVKALGTDLLSAIEKQDNEAISLLRAEHENTILGLAEMIKYSQWQDAQKATQALQLSLANATQRYRYYQTLLGRTDAQITSSIPQLSDLDAGSLQNLSFSQTDPSSEPIMPLDTINPDISQNATQVSDGEIKTLTTHEVTELEKLADARSSIKDAQNSESTAATLGFIPDISVNLEPLGVGASTSIGGTYASKFPAADARGSRADADGSTYDANNTAKLGTYSHRELDWLFQSNTAKSDINQIIKQIRGAQIREAIAKRDFENHQVQMANAQQIQEFLKGTDIGRSEIPVKETTVGFYALMKRQVKALYAKSFQLAYEVAKKAERALQNELGDPSLSYIQFNYLNGAEGLYAGETLLQDIKTMEMVYHDLNQREYELTKHVSLLQITPLALVQLRATGTCTFTMPEELFDMDGPGHYFRRTKSVAVTIPCVAGPYTSVNCNLSLQKSSIRISTDPGKTYARQGSDDPRFNDYYGTLQSIVTSSAQADSGLFESNLKDERYLPFEETGVAGSQWQLALPSEVRQFDFDTITDVIIHVRYTAREGGQLLRTAAIQNLQGLINKGQTVGSTCLFSIRHEFPTEWAKFQSVTISAATPTAELSLNLRPELYPFWSQGVISSSSIKAVEFFADMLTAITTVNISDSKAHNDTLVRNPLLGNLLAGNLVKIPLPAAITDTTHPPLTLFFDSNSMEDLWVAITWGK